MKRVAVVALLAVALAGCAVPGQSLSPGTAYAYNGVDVSNAQVDAIYNAWLHDSQGKLTPNRLQVMVLDAAHDPAVAMAKEIAPEVGELFAPENSEFLAKQMLAVKQVDAEPSAEFVRSVQSAVAVWFIAYTDTDGTQVQRLADELEKNIEGSPRAGDFNGDVFISSIARALQSADSQGIPPQLAYTEFFQLNGFVASDGGVRVVAPAPETAAAPTPSPAP